MHSRLVAALVTALAGVSVFTDFFGVGWPAKSGALVIAVAVAFWLFRQQLPTFKDLLIVLLFATTTGLLLGRIDIGDDTPTFYDFVVVPKQAVTVESAFPGPRHEARNSA